MSQSLQLAAIMFTDIAGYTALMGDDEYKAFEILRKDRELQKPVVERHGGKCVKEVGDGILACFTTATDAVIAAIEIQKAANTMKAFELRIGIHLGEVVFEDNDVFGNGVNISSRLQAVAPIGGIWISESVYNNVSNKNEITSKFVRDEILKNVKEPIRIYEVLTGNKTGMPGATPEKHSASLTEKSISVLPFINMSNDPEQEYFSNGMGEEQIANLSRLKDVRVESRTTSMQYKGTKKDAKTIGRELSVGYILDGSVRKFQDNLRITTQLIEVENDTHLWAETFKGKLDDIFDIQEEVAKKIVDALRVTLSPVEIPMIRGDICFMPWSLPRPDI